MTRAPTHAQRGAVDVEAALWSLAALAALAWWLWPRRSDRTGDKPADDDWGGNNDDRT